MVLSSTIEAGFKDVKFGEFVQKLNNRYTHSHMSESALKQDETSTKL